jgi:hypothetical protein
MSSGIEVAGDILSHNIYGPRKPSWGIEMTIISSVMRDAGRHSHLVDIVSAFYSPSYSVTRSHSNCVRVSFDG